ncbi:site-specific integrase [Leuconostoc carnosum]|uniref:site-specific integrase n=1 Tax=Leuconostoc carnosum TaxID=1252 RepID=UPI0012391CD9|nr:site-specific integrase [Leuconostoc carnosum]KAA8371136.1 site-specific integrase [Leuconostoc carnosum]KAA8382777.1 site-specific integrase [Leuconostoc carnosum]
MASIYKRGKSWTANVSVVVDDKRVRKTKSGFITKRDAQKWANDAEFKKQNKQLSTNDSLFVDEFEDWYTVFKEPQLETATKLWYKTTKNLLVKKWPTKKINEVTSKDFQILLNDYGDNHVKSSILKIKNIIKSFVIFSMDDGVIIKDFTRSVTTRSKVKSKDADLKFLEVTEMKKLIERIRYNNSISCKMILTAAYSGLRFSEITGLTPDDFDFKNNTITVNKSWQMQDQEFKDPKTATSNRTVTMPDSYMSIAKKWTLGKRFAFEGNDGKPISNNAVNKRLRYYLDMDGSKPITFHGLRHTHASYLLSKDIAIQYVSERLGHSDVNITLSVYSHLLEKKRKQETLATIKILNEL